MTVYNEFVATSETSWVEAALNAVEKARTGGDVLTTAQVVELDLDLTGPVVLFRTRLSFSQGPVTS